MLLLTALGVALQIQAGILNPEVSVYGRITGSSGDGTSDAPVAGSLVQLTGPALTSPRLLTADATGAYSIPALEAGVYSLRFEHQGYVPLTLAVRVPAHASVHLDVTLDREPPALETIRVLAREARERVEAPGVWSAYRPWRLTGERLRVTPSLDFPDVTRAVTMSPAAQVTPESGGALRLQGGATGHTLLQVDGIPLYNAIHAGERPSALDPDAVAAIDVYGEPPASEGGRLTGVVDVRTRANLPDSEHLRSTIWPTGVRALTAIRFRKGSALVSARRDYARPVQGNDREPVTLGWNDVFATASTPFAQGTLTGMIFSAADGVSFDAFSEAETPAALPIGNRIDWRSNAGALTWRLDSDRRSIEAKAWRSGTSVSGHWVPIASHSLNLASTFAQTAVEGKVSWRGARNGTTIGATFEQLSAEYSSSAATDSSGSPTSYSRLAVASRPVVGSAFIEHSLRVGDHLTFTLGQRAVSFDGKGLMLEPRLAAAFAAANGMTLSGAFARTHQYTQSLYNEESVVDAMASLEIPVLAGTNGLPVASSNSASGQLTMPLGASGLLTVGAFGRTFRGIVLASPGTSSPFPADSFRTGGGSAYGGRIALQEQLGRLSLEGAYSASAVFREKSEQTYRPAVAPAHNVLIAAGYQLGQGTMLRASGLLSVLRSTSPVVGSIGWEWQDALASQREVTGSPQYSAATFGAGRLPPYLRIDVGVRHETTFGFPVRGKATLFANVDNLLGRRNAIGMSQPAVESARRLLPALPRSLSFGIALHF